MLTIDLSPFPEQVSTSALPPEHPPDGRGSGFVGLARTPLQTRKVFRCNTLRLQIFVYIYQKVIQVHYLCKYIQILL